MPTLLERGLSIYRGEGLESFVKKSSRYGVNRVACLPLMDDLLYSLSVKKLNHKMQAENDLNDIVDTTFSFRGFGRYRTIKPIQIRQEFTKLARYVAELNPKTVMEIGTANGGTFYTWARYLDSASTVISLDLPGGDFGGGYTKEKTQFFNEFADDKGLVFIRADSHDQNTLDYIKSEVPEDGLDFLFIDGDHRYNGVKQDFEMYSSLVSDNGMIAFHDIVPGPKEYVGGVPKFWREIKSQYDTKEIIADQDQDGYGLGLVLNP